ncbi:MAG: T9SS type A sorting domain-containing protein [Flavobacteriales bacterium]|nr:T9SS type A sorting domain-containing protein [Flavobacteriales bacterium]
MNLKTKIATTVLMLMLVNEAFAGAWVQRANFGGVGRHRASAFSIQDKGYMGLGHINSVSNILYEDIWEYDPASDTWTQKANFGGGARYHASAFTIGNKAYCGTGRDNFSLYLDDFWEYDPLTNVWTQVADFGGTARSGAASFTVDGKGYVGSGTVSSSGSNDFYEYNATTDVWTSIATFPGNQRNTGVAFSIDNKGYFGTATGTYGAGKDFWEYKPAVDQWIQRADVGTLVRAGAAGFSLKGKGYILIGTDWGTGENFKDVWEYNPLDNSWRQLNDFPGSKRRFMECFVIGDVAYCGIGTNGINFSDFWSFDANSVGMDEVEARTVSVFPNPVVDKIYFDFKQESNESFVVIYDLFGKKVMEDQLNDDQSVSCNELMQGTYIYQLYEGQEYISGGKFVVVK